MFPLLSQRLADGRIRVEDREYVGIASDDVRVTIGSVGSETQVENYLHSHPNTTDW